MPSNSINRLYRKYTANTLPVLQRSGTVFFRFKNRYRYDFRYIGTSDMIPNTIDILYRNYTVETLPVLRRSGAGDTLDGSRPGGTTRSLEGEVHAICLRSPSTAAASTSRGWWSLSCEKMQHCFSRIVVGGEVLIRCLP